MLVVVDYGMGNIHSVSKAIETVGADVLVSSKPQDLEQADMIVLLGVGSFSQGMKHLSELNMIDKLTEEVMVKKKPFLGICLGMHLAAKTGEEGGLNQGLNWIDFDSYGPDVWDISMFSPDELINGGGYVNNFGYDHAGNKLSGNPSLDDFFNTLDENGDNLRESPSFRPIYV